MSELRTEARIRSIWKHMKNRCYNPNYVYYWRYGGRGIEVCEEWKHNFKAFREWALSHGYEDSLSIDRIDNDKGYSPENCRFSNQKTQLRNMSRNHMITKDGETHCIADWADITGINKSTISTRILYLGWDEVRAISEGVRKWQKK